MTITQLDSRIKDLEDKINNIDKELAGGTETWSRITGYYRCTDYWNDGKKQEFSERLEYHNF